MTSIHCTDFLWRLWQNWCHMSVLSLASDSVILVRSSSTVKISEYSHFVFPVTTSVLSSGAPLSSTSGFCCSPFAHSGPSRYELQNWCAQYSPGCSVPCPSGAACCYKWKLWDSHAGMAPHTMHCCWKVVIFNPGHFHSCVLQGEANLEGMLGSMQKRSSC